MITDRDAKILEFINIYGGITIKQCAKLFFNKAKYSEDLARKRLKKLYDNEVLKYEEDWATNQRVYFNKKKPSSHSIMLMNFYAELICHGANVIQFEKEYKVENICRPDAFVIFQNNNKAKIAFLEVDMSHRTDISKYEKLFDTNMFQDQYGTFPELILISSTKEYETGYPFSIKVLDYSLRNFKEKVLRF